jgi:hypothetical protein
MGAVRVTAAIYEFRAARTLLFPLVSSRSVSRAMRACNSLCAASSPRPAEKLRRAADRRARRSVERQGRRSTRAASALSLIRKLHRSYGAECSTAEHVSAFARVRSSRPTPLPLHTSASSTIGRAESAANGGDVQQQRPPLSAASQRRQTARANSERRTQVRTRNQCFSGALSPLLGARLLVRRRCVGLAAARGVYPLPAGGVARVEFARPLARELAEHTGQHASRCTAAA